ncbi:HDOD domain-containing protein [Rariglobus hedericola]|uniref:HDOD domain-containing protein n=1 Tax=Rariglobus hedericola TaxID=2597822 RepID=A0A556QR54_9BACT|nr:HDOD domain-containing protein [Rariglobus hedericola]TSJ79109.1 HDOD domain-containing protein [Rariglobus hedericola]
MHLAEASPIHLDLFKAAARLPASAQIFERINAALRNPDVRSHEIIDILSQDPATALRVLRLANSVQFVRGEPFASLERAVDWIGITHVYHLLAVTVSANLFCKSLPHYDVTSDQLWRNAVATGTAMHLIAEAGGADPRRAYSVGLFRPVGRMLFQQLATQRELPLPKRMLRDNGETLAWEKSCFEVHNAEAVAYLFEIWGLNRSMGEIIGHHYEPLEASHSPEASGTALLHVACWMAREAGYGLSIESNAWNINPAVLQQACLPSFNLAPYVKRTKEITARLTVTPSNN